MKRALLIIDMQKGAFVPDTPRYKAKEVMNNINSLSQMFRQNHEHVIFIQHDGSRFGSYLPNTEEWEIVEELQTHRTDSIISKTVNDAFYQSELDSLLKQNGTRELVITGCATDYCVNATIHNALTKDYSITVIADAHTTADRPPIAAADVIDHYNRIWADLFPTRGRIQVVSTQEFKTLSNETTIN